MWKNLRNLKDVKKHELIHSGVNPCKCSNCAKGFIYPDKVKRHKVIHGVWLFHLWQTSRLFLVDGSKLCTVIVYLFW